MKFDPNLIKDPGALAMAFIFKLILLLPHWGTNFLVKMNDSTSKSQEEGAEDESSSSKRLEIDLDQVLIVCFYLENRLQNLT